MKLKRPKPYDLTTHDGKKVNWLTKVAVQRAEKILGYALSITQGSFNYSVDQSGNTHDGGGAADFKGWDAENKMKALRACGFVAWVREEDEGDWPKHVHAILMTDRSMSAAARRQVEAYRAGRNGLKNNLPDPHADIPVVPFHWPYYGTVGLARWHRDQLTGKERTDYLKRLRAVVRGN